MSKLNDLTRQSQPASVREREVPMFWLYMTCYYIWIKVETDETNSLVEGIAYWDDLTFQILKMIMDGDEQHEAIGPSKSCMHPMAENYKSSKGIAKEIRRKNINDMKREKIT